MAHWSYGETAGSQSVTILFREKMIKLDWPLFGIPKAV